MEDIKSKEVKKPSAIKKWVNGLLVSLGVKNKKDKEKESVFKEEPKETIKIDSKKKDPTEHLEKLEAVVKEEPKKKTVKKVKKDVKKVKSKNVEGDKGDTADNK